MRAFAKYTIYLILFLILSALSIQQVTYWMHAPEGKRGTQLGEVGGSGMVSSAHPLASKVGQEILKQGGNAYDAAIAVKFALAVTYQQAGNIGGGGFLVHRMADGTVGALDFREKAPLQAHRDMYLDEDGNVIPGLSLKGHLAVGVPGSVDGMVRLHGRYGTMPWAKLIEPAIDLAREGYSVTQKEADDLNRFQDDMKALNRFEPAAYKEGGWTKGDQALNTELADTLQRIADRGRSGFYKGQTAKLLIEEMKSGNGLITQDDLDRYASVWRKPQEFEYRGHQIIAMPLPSSGGVALAQMFKGAEMFDVGALEHNGTDHVHLMTELQRRVYADRAEWLGDPDFVSVDEARLLSDDYLKNRFSTIDMDRKTDSQDVKAGQVEMIESFETTHFSVVDQWGNAVAVTTTLNGYYGAKVVVKGAGFFLNNEMDDFSIKPGHANQFGLVGNEKNAIQPEKRMLSSMVPTIVSKDGKLSMVVGSPGGSTIITAVFQTISNVIDFGMTLQEAVNARKTHSQWLPDAIMIEKGAVSVPTLFGLLSKGHVPIVWPVFQWELGRVDSIRVLNDGQLEGAADPRGKDDKAVGY